MQYIVVKKQIIFLYLCENWNDGRVMKIKYPTINGRKFYFNSL
jgi:hypothetical protein